MKRWRALPWGALPLGAVCVASACSIYDPSLIGDADAGSESGGRGAGGATASSGGQSDTGSGGAPSGGALTSSGGAGPSTGGAAESCDWGATSSAGGSFSLLDDFDDNDKWILEQDGRTGRWNVDNDQSNGAQSPSGLGWESLPMSERSDSAGNLALHYVGVGFSSWHLVLAELAAGAPLDLSAHAGFRLWVRGDCAPASGDLVQLRVAISDATSANSAGEVDHAGYALPFSLSPAWRLVKVPFSALTRRFGSTAAFDATTARSFIISPNAPGDLDLWVDDVAFYAP